MSPAKSLILTALATLAASACTPQRAAPEPLPEAVILTADEMAVLAFLNDHDIATHELLDVECAIRRDAATNLIEYRDGADGQAGTRDDNHFDTPREITDVKEVGPWTLQQLTECADGLGYKPAPTETAVLNFVNDPATSFERLDRHCGLRSDSADALLFHRDGPDGLPATADDNPIHSLEELDAVFLMGERSLELVELCAPRFGYSAVAAPE